LCRPPGHHCGADYLGGYCYLNNAAIAAQAATAAGTRVAILDFDYHHGNGTQDIFYARGDTLFVSIHADPATDYPFYWGHADEIGEGEGEGATLNLPLPQGTGVDPYRRTLGTALERIAASGADFLICSYGADTFVGDPGLAFHAGNGGLSDYRPRRRGARSAHRHRDGGRLCGGRARRQCRFVPVGASARIRLMVKWLTGMLAALLLAGLRHQRRRPDTLNAVAEAYVRLSLEAGLTRKAISTLITARPLEAGGRGVAAHACPS
jgi:hypothetical protein